MDPVENIRRRSPLGLLETPAYVDKILVEWKGIVEELYAPVKNNSEQFDVGLFEKQIQETLDREPKARRFFKELYPKLQQAGEKSLISFTERVLIKGWALAHHYRLKQESNPSYRTASEVKRQFVSRGRCSEHGKLRNTVDITREEARKIAGREAAYAYEHKPVCLMCNKQENPFMSYFRFAMPDFLLYQKLLKNAERAPKQSEEGIDYLTKQNLAWGFTARVKQAPRLGTKIADSITGIDTYIASNKQKATAWPNALKDTYGVIALVTNDAAKDMLIGYLRGKELYGKEEDLEKIAVLGSPKNYWDKPKKKMNEKGEERIVYQGMNIALMYSLITKKGIQINSPIELQIATLEMHLENQRDHVFYEERREQRSQLIEQIGIPYSKIREVINETLSLNRHI